jgi:hypothetical protein
MPSVPENLRAALRELAAGIPYSQAAALLEAELERLVDQRMPGLGLDELLTGTPLEIRVEQLFVSAGFAVKRGRPSREDFVINLPEGAKTLDPCVIEVKSHHKDRAVKWDDLRQLDDWVFDLSGEDVARKEGLRGGPSAGPLQPLRHRHPSPQKGILVFNGPLLPFDQRPPSCVGHRQVPASHYPLPCYP